MINVCFICLYMYYNSDVNGNESLCMNMGERSVNVSMRGGEIEKELAI